MPTPVATDMRLHGRNDGVNGTARGVAVVCSLGDSLTTMRSLDVLDCRLDGLFNDPTRAAASFDSSDRAVAAAATPRSRRILSP